MQTFRKRRAGLSATASLSCEPFIPADDALMQQCAMAYCTCTLAATLTRELAELTGPDLWSTNRMIFRTYRLCFFAYLHESNLKLRFLHVLRTNVTVNITKVVINILQGSAVQ